MFTEKEVAILKEIIKNYDSEQLNISIKKQRALEWWENMREDCIGHSDVFTKSNLAYKYKKCHHKGLTEDDIINIWVNLNE